MKVAVSSLFRNAVDGLDLYFARMGWLREELEARGDSLALVLSEGDSVDGTLDGLVKRCAGYDCKVVKLDHGGPYFGSTVDARRFRQLALAGNAAMEHIPADADAWLFVERDLVWEPGDLLTLLNDLATVPAVAPLVLGPDGTFFYDTWAYRAGGQHFGPQPPYHPALQNGDPRTLVQTLVPIDTAGSVLALRGDLARACRFTPENAIVGLCEQIAAAGAQLYVDPRVAVNHP